MRLVDLLNKAKDAKDKNEIAENYIFKRASDEIDPKAELRDQLGRVDELLKRLKML